MRAALLLTLLAGLVCAEGKKTAKVTNVVYFDIKINGEDVSNANNDDDSASQLLSSVS